MQNIFNILLGVHFLGNTLLDYLIFLTVFILAILILKIFQGLILVRLKKIAEKTENTFDDAIIETFQKIGFWFFVFLSFVISLRFLFISEQVMRGLNIILVACIAYQVARVLQNLINYVIELYLDKVTKTEKEKKQGRAILRIIRVSILGGFWVIVGIMVLANLGVNVTSLITGLGIGGVAIALAVQNILSDLFSSFTIFLDKPFQVGDYIKVGKDSGNVEHIGLKTTQIKTLRGEALVIPNKELTSTRIQNFRHMKRRREAFTFGILYNTPKKQRVEIPEMVQSIIEGIEGLEFERCHFAQLADSSLNFEVVYYVNSSDYTLYMDTKQQVNLALMEAFEKKQIEFAYPTQTIYLEK